MPPHPHPPILKRNHQMNKCCRRLNQLHPNQCCLINFARIIQNASKTYDRFKPECLSSHLAAAGWRHLGLLGFKLKLPSAEASTSSPTFLQINHTIVIIPTFWDLFIQGVFYCHPPSKKN